MLSVEQNERVTQTAPGTPAGNLLRHYWQPVALCEELDPSRPVAAVTVLGESLVLFRNEHGELGLIDRACPHRGADLCFGRLEDGGLRCLFHGWLFDVEGKCLEQPAEPLGSTYFNHIQQKAHTLAESVTAWCLRLWAKARRLLYRRWIAWTHRTRILLPLRGTMNVIGCRRLKLGSIRRTHHSCTATSKREIQG